jgi:hypothetical protein
MASGARIREGECEDRIRFIITTPLPAELNSLGPTITLEGATSRTSTGITHRSDQAGDSGSQRSSPSPDRKTVTATTRDGRQWVGMIRNEDKFPFS